MTGRTLALCLDLLSLHRRAGRQVTWSLTVDCAYWPSWFDLTHSLVRGEGQQEKQELGQAPATGTLTPPQGQTAQASSHSRTARPRSGHQAPILWGEGFAL